MAFTTLPHIENPRKSLSERFWAKVAIAGPNKCWEWKASLIEDSYGQFNINGRPYTANRVAWVLVYGDIPDENLEVCHSCDNKKCCNPIHFFLGTHSDNAIDMFTKGAHSKTHWHKSHCKNGHPMNNGAYRIEVHAQGRHKSRRCIICKKQYDRKRRLKKLREQEQLHIAGSGGL